MVFGGVGAYLFFRVLFLAFQVKYHKVFKAICAKISGLTSEGP